MVFTEHLGLFVLNGVLPNLTPGQDTLYIVGRSVSQGRRAGLLPCWALCREASFTMFAAAFGLSAILAMLAQGFVVMKLAGAVYLAYLGIRRHSQRPTSVGTAAEFTPERDWAV